MAAYIAHLLTDPQARAAGRAFYRQIFGFGDNLDRCGQVLDQPMAGAVY